MKFRVRALRPLPCLAVVFSLLLLPTASAQVTAIDDGGPGSPFVTGDEDSVLDTTGGLSVVTNDTGTLVITGADSLSALGAAVSVNPDGTFSYDPRAAGALQAIAAGATLEDTFAYQIAEDVPVTPGVSTKLTATLGTNTVVWGGLSAPVAATGTGLPAGITKAYQMSPGGTRSSYDGAPGLDDVSIEIWFKPDVVDEDQVLFETGGTGTGSALVINDDATVSWVVRNGTIPIVQSTTTVVPGTWYHVVATYDKDNPSPTDTLELFLNAVSEGTATAADADDWSGSDGAGLGRSNGTTAADNTNVDGDGTDEDYGDFTGQIGIFRLYLGKALNGTEVTTNFNAASVVVPTDIATVTVGVTGVNDAPVAHDDTVDSPVALEDSLLTSTADLRINDGPVLRLPGNVTGAPYVDCNASIEATAVDWPNLGTLASVGGDLTVNGATLDTNPTTTRPGITAALDFDDAAGGSAAMTVGAGDGPQDFPGNVDAADATFEIWAKLAPGDLTQISTLFETGGGIGVGIVVDNGVLQAATETDGATQNESFVSYDLQADPQGLVGGDPTADFNQYVVALDIDGGLELFVNGTSVDSTATGTGADWDGGDAAGVGRFGGANHGGFQNGAAATAYDSFFKGSMAVFRIYPELFDATRAMEAFDAIAGDGILLLNYNTSEEASDTLWPNIGSLQTTQDDINLTGVTLDASPTTSRPGITAALDFDDTTGGAGLMGSTRGFADFPGAIDKADATFEFWVKLHPDDLNQISTLFETGGGTGVGLVIDNGELQGASEDDGLSQDESFVSYDLETDPLGVVDGTLTTEFQQIVMTLDLDGGLELFVNGTSVAASTSGVAPGADWDGGDAFGLGHFGEDNHGGFQGGAATTPYDTFFKGSMAIFRFYGTILSGPQVLQNYKAVADGQDIDGEAFTVTAILADTGAPVSSGFATLPSGALARLDAADGSFTYDPNGQFEDLAFGITTTDTFTYRLEDGSGGQSDATVTVTISGKNDPVDDTIAATEALVTNVKANQIVGNDQHALAVSDAFFSVDAASVSGSNWFNIGSGGDTYDVNVTSGTVVNPPALQSNFGAVGAAWRNVAGSVTSVQDISGDDATFEVWFKPEPLQAGKQVLLESGGSGNGMSIVFDADNNEVVFTVDGGDDATASIVASAGGVVTGEFNQAIAVYDQDDAGQGGADTLTLYLNNDPGSAFDATVDGSGLNAASLANNWSGTDLTGIGAVAGAVALGEAVVPFLGDISIVRIYSRKLSTVEMAANFDAVVQEIVDIEGGTSFTTGLGATVTLNADRSFDFDATSLTSDIPDGDVVQDSFSYTISDGAGGFETATVTVDVTGVDDGFLALDDDVNVGEGDGPTVIAVLDNDNFTSATVALQSTIGGYLAEFEAGTAAGDLGDALSGSWSYLWTAPSDWTGGIGGTSANATTGGFGVSVDYEPLVWTGTRWTADGDEDTGTGDPSSFLRLTAIDGHPGFGSTNAGTNGNNVERGVVVAYTVPSDGFYGIANSFLTKPSAAGDGISAVLYAEDTAQGSFSAAPGGSTSFDANLGFASAGQKIYIGVSPGVTAASDAFNWDFDVVSLPSAESQIIEIIGTVSTDGTTITYDPGGSFVTLAVGQSVTETLTYTIVDGASTSTATLTITVDGQNDAPIGVLDFAETAEGQTVAGNVLTNDIDLDAGETATLVVGEVEGSAGNVGVELTLASGAKVTVQADGSYLYDPNGAFDSLVFGVSAQDSFTYVVQDVNGLNDTISTSVSIDIFGLPDNQQETVANATQEVPYFAGATDVAIVPPVVVDGGNDGIASTVTEVFAFDGTTTVFGDGVTPDQGTVFDVDGLQGFPQNYFDGFAVTLAFVPTAADIADGTRRNLYDFGGSSNGHGIYLIDGVPHLFVKMNGSPANVPTGLNDPNWDDNTISVPLTGAKVPTGEATDLALIFSLDKLSFTVNGGAITTVQLTGRDPLKDNWAGDHTVRFGTGGAGGGATSSAAGAINEDTFTSPEGDVVECRFWNVSSPAAAALDPEILTATLTINPSEGAFSEPAGSSYTPGTGVWTVSGTPSQVNVALAAVAFQPLVSTPVDAAVEVQDGGEEGTSPVTGTLTFTENDSPFDSWVASNGLTGGNEAPGADGEKDTLFTLLEFGFGTDPNASDNLPLLADGARNGAPVTQASAGGGQELLFVRRDDHGTPGSVTYTIEFSGDLVTFYEETETAPIFVADSTDDAAYEVVSIPYPPALPNGQVARFARIVVEQVP